MRFPTLQFALLLLCCLAVAVVADRAMGVPVWVQVAR